MFINWYKINTENFALSLWIQLYQNETKILFDILKLVASGKSLKKIGLFETNEWRYSEYIK